MLTPEEECEQLTLEETYEIIQQLGTIQYDIVTVDRDERDVTVFVVMRKTKECRKLALGAAA